MIRLTYAIGGQSHPIEGWERRRDVGTAERGDVLWHYFPGDFRIITADGELATDFGWVPILHLSMGLIGIAAELSQSDGARPCYQFTESDEVIYFRRSGERMFITWSLDPEDVLSCEVTEFSHVIKHFVDQVMAELGELYPRLLKNPISEELRQKANSL